MGPQKPSLEVVSETTPLIGIGVKLPQLSIYFRPFVGDIYLYITPSTTRVGSGPWFSIDLEFELP